MVIYMPGILGTIELNVLQNDVKVIMSDGYLYAKDSRNSRVKPFQWVQATFGRSVRTQRFLKKN